MTKPETAIEKRDRINRERHDAQVAENIRNGRRRLKTSAEHQAAKEQREFFGGDLRD